MGIDLVALFHTATPSPPKPPILIMVFAYTFHTSLNVHVRVSGVHPCLPSVSHPFLGIVFLSLLALASISIVRHTFSSFSTSLSVLLVLCLDARLLLIQILKDLLTFDGRVVVVGTPLFVIRIVVILVVVLVVFFFFFVVLRLHCVGGCQFSLVYCLYCFRYRHLYLS